MRRAEVNRKTAETEISLSLELDGTGAGKVNTGVGFLDHMLILTALHGRLNLTAACFGDLEVDQHHTVEDIGIVFGEAFRRCLGNKEKIERYASAAVPMDEALAEVFLDISGRSCLVYNVPGLKEKVGGFDTELAEEFFHAFVRHAGITLHVQLRYGTNSHHMLEAVFKAFGRVLRQSTALTGDGGIPSTKGIL